LESRYPKSNDWVRKHLGGLDVEPLQKWIGDASVQKKTTSVKTRKEFWEENWRLTDDLRLILLDLREAFDLPARLTASTRGADALAIELATAAIHAADPSSLNQDGKNLLQHRDWREGKPRGISLTDVVVPVLDNLLATALEGGAGQVSGHEKTDGLPGREIGRHAVDDLFDEQVHRYTNTAPSHPRTAVKSAWKLG
jgi:hypothetical protein